MFMSLLARRLACVDRLELYPANPTLFQVACTRPVLRLIALVVPQLKAFKNDMALSFSVQSMPAVLPCSNGSTGATHLC